MNEQGLNPKPKKSSGWKIFIIILLLIFGVGGYFGYQYYLNKGDNSNNNPANSTGQKVSITQKILDNKFGWLGGGADDTGEGIIARGGLWVRPHPGAFVWDMVQKELCGENGCGGKNEPFDFTLSDQEVGNYQKNDLGILATIWPFADWDQKNLANADDCKVASTDEFLSKNDKKGRGFYLPEYRCNPSDWVAYQKFVGAIVERYDGDGVNDMPKLNIPNKYWEVMNEPDLQYQNNLPANESDRLNFYKQGPTEYAELLIKTSEGIRKADPEAKILIAGAAGADSRMLSFYQDVFKNTAVASAFDIGNIHCISNDQKTNDFNVASYKSMLESAGITDKPIWVTEAEAMYSQNSEENFQSTQKSVIGAIAAGAERIFFTRDDFGDTRTDMSQENETSGDSKKDSENKYKIITSQN